MALPSPTPGLRRRGVPSYQSLAPRTSALGVLPDLAEVDPDARLVADNLGVVAGRDRGGLAGCDLLLGSVVHRHLHAARHAVAEMVDLARVRAGDRLQVRGPLPARL